MTGTPESWPRRPVPAMFVGHGLADLADDVAQALALDHGRIERRARSSASSPSSESSLPRMISLASTRSMSFSYSAPSGSSFGNSALGQAAALGRLARREQRNDAARAVDQLQVGDEVAQLLDRLARQQRLAFDHDQHVELARREAPRHLFVLPELGGVGAEQLAQRVVDLDALDAEECGDREQRPGSAPSSGR